MARALAYAEGVGPQPMELVAARLVDRFGAQAVYGRLLGYGEMQRMALAESVVEAYHSRQRSASWVEWAKTHPELSRLLIKAARA